MSFRQGFVVLVVFFLGSFDALAGPSRYFAAVFAYQDWLNIPKNAHSFAYFVELPDGPEGTAAFAKERTISWLPRTLQVVFTGAAEPGVNLTLRSSIELGLGQGRVVTEWGPYEISETLFRRAVAQSERLERGELTYQCLDGGVRPDRGTNCIHALTDLDMEKGLLDTGTARGRDASRLIVKHLAPWLVDKERVHPAVDRRLGIADYPIDHETIW